MRILIAEDDFTSRTVLAGMLEKAGHQVTVTVNGAEAWRVMQQPDAPPLVILDWLMPEMDGAEVGKAGRDSQGFCGWLRGGEWPPGCAFDHHTD